MKPQIGWAIRGEFRHANGRVEHFLYVGWWLNRYCAIADHVRDRGRTWKQCRARGDRAVRVKISELEDSPHV